MKKATVILVVALMACGSLFASESVSGPVLKMGMANGGATGYFAEKAGVAETIALDLSDDYAERFFEAYFMEDTAFGKEKVELLPEELEALRNSAKVADKACGQLGDVFFKDMDVSLKESIALSKVAGEYAKSIENIKKGDVYNRDVFAVAGLISVLGSLDEMKVKTVDGIELTFGEVLIRSNENLQLDESEETQRELGLGIMGAAIYFNMLCGSYEIDLVSADIVPGTEM